MAEIRLTSSQLRGKKENLLQLNQNFLEIMNGLDEAVAALDACWEGEAKDAFRQAYQRDRGQMDTFHALIGQYTQRMEEITLKYEETERRSAALAGERTY